MLLDIEKRKFAEKELAIIWYTLITLWHELLQKKIIQLQFSSECSIKTRSTKTIILILKFIRITYSIIYNY